MQGAGNSPYKKLGRIGAAMSTPIATTKTKR
jgi:hypothetical protein